MPAAQQEIARLTELLDKIAKTDPEEKLIRPDLGTASFDDAVPVLERTVSLFKNVRLSDWHIFPQHVIQKFIHRADVLVRWLDEVDRFDLKQSGSVQQRDSMIQNLEAEFGNLISELGPYIFHLLWEGKDFEATARAKMRDFDEYTLVQRQEQERIVQEMELILQKTQLAAGEVGVGQQSVIFGSQAKKNKWTAWGWLASGVVFGGGARSPLFVEKSARVGSLG